MSDNTFPNGTSLQSSALTPQEFATVFQTLTARILGYNIPSTDPQVNKNAYFAVRVGWQQTGQPAWKITEDVCVLTAYPLNDEYGRVRDQVYTYLDSVNLELDMSYTQVWTMHWSFYGPNAFDHARLIVSSMSLDWVHDYLQNPPPPVNTQIYAVAEWTRPKYSPELFQGQWWQRADVDLKFNELVKEVTTVNSALSASVTIITDSGQTETVTMTAS